MKNSTANIDEIRERAQGRWPSIFDALGIEVGTGKHRPCPVCGGRDRFRFDDKNGSGSWFCNVCDPHAGDGFSLVMKVCGYVFPEALRRVAGVLGLESSVRAGARRPLLPAPVRVDRRVLAFQFELAALDFRIRAEGIAQAAMHMDIGFLTDTELDRALGHAAQGQSDEQRAQCFESVADGLRGREFTERESREQRQRVA